MGDDKPRNELLRSLRQDTTTATIQGDTRGISCKEGVTFLDRVSPYSDYNKAKRKVDNPTCKPL